MSEPILTTKLYIPPPRPKAVPRSRLIGRLNEGMSQNQGFGCKLTLVSAPAGFGKTTLVSEWVSGFRKPVAWLSLDDEDNDPARFLTYLIAALQTIASNIGQGLSDVIQPPQPPPVESILTALLNEIAIHPDHFILVLDDYHVIDAKPIDDALIFLIEHMPPRMHLVIATREDPNLPLARLRARNQLTELRIADLRFTPEEATNFFNRVMGLNLFSEDVAALETRTEGWVVGLQLAALALQRMHWTSGTQDPGDFIQSFSGTNQFILDYLLKEVLELQPAPIQAFLLRTAILNRLCGPLCDAVCSGDNENAEQHLVATGQETLEYLEHANLFIIPLDNDRRWYRYHHLFADLLRQRLHQGIDTAVTSSSELKENGVAELHRRASRWFENNGYGMYAFQHAAAANDFDCIERLLENGEIPVHYSGAVTPVLDWFRSLPTWVLDARPSLWVRYATFSLAIGQTAGVEAKLRAAETALQSAAPNDRTRDLLGIIAAAKATLALSRYQVEAIMAESRRALEQLRPENLAFRFTAVWTLAFAHYLRGERKAASEAYTEALSISQTSGDLFSMILAQGGIGQVQELENQLYPAAETYQQILQLYGEHPQPIASEAELGLARIYYEWNDLDTAKKHGLQSLRLARQYDGVIDRYIASEVFLARLKLALGDEDGASVILDQAEQSVRKHTFIHRMPEVAAAQVLVLLCQGHFDKAAYLAQTHALPLYQARVHLAQGDMSAALDILEPLRQQVEAKGWADERLKVMVFQAVVLYAWGETNKAVLLLRDALKLAKPGGFIRTFIDEGPLMARLLSETASQKIMPDYVGKLLTAFGTCGCVWGQNIKTKPHFSPAQSLKERLSPRELEVLQLIAQGLTNHEIGKRLFLALDTVKGHNRKIFDKLQVERRTEAVARARELGLL